MGTLYLYPTGTGSVWQSISGLWSDIDDPYNATNELDLVKATAENFQYGYCTMTDIALSGITISGVRLYCYEYPYQFNSQRYSSKYGFFINSSLYTYDCNFSGYGWFMSDTGNLTVSPKTGNAWTVSELNGVQLVVAPIGFNVGKGIDGTKIAQIYLKVTYESLRMGGAILLCC